MERINRNPEKFEVIDLFSALGRKEGFVFRDSNSEQRFVQRVEELFKQHQEDPNILYGRRVEAMFGYVAASLGKCILIKQEDEGELYATATDIQPPDYRIVLDNGFEFFVEVKNCNKVKPSARFTLNKTSVDKLKKYATMFKQDLKMAIYWSRWNIWTLISIDKIISSKGGLSVSLLDAIKMNEMGIIGDLMVATTPPLIFRVVTDANKPRSVDEQGRVGFTIGGVELYCGNTRIEGKVEQSLAFYFMLYGKWHSDEPEAHIENDQLLWIDIRAYPEETTSGQGFEFLGALSGMISQRYNELTTSEQGVERLSPAQEPGSLGVNIPQDYKGHHLPLWRFEQQFSQKSQEEDS